MDPARRPSRSPHSQEEVSGAYRAELSGLLRRTAASLLLSAALLGGCGDGAEADEQTIELAKQAFREAKARGVDMSPGPCLGVIKEGWVADVAHDPRQDVDDEPENQCEAYRSGEADHFVELDPEGEFIRSG
jgi:hypothetical protein